MDFPRADRPCRQVEIEVRNRRRAAPESVARVSVDFNPWVGRKSPAGESYFERRDATLPHSPPSIEQVQTRAPPCFARSAGRDNRRARASTKRRRSALFARPCGLLAPLLGFLRRANGIVISLKFQSVPSIRRPKDR